MSIMARKHIYKLSIPEISTEQHFTSKATLIEGPDYTPYQELEITFFKSKADDMDDKLEFIAGIYAHDLESEEGEYKARADFENYDDIVSCTIRSNGHIVASSNVVITQGYDEVLVYDVFYTDTKDGSNRPLCRLKHDNTLIIDLAIPLLCRAVNKMYHETLSDFDYIAGELELDCEL